MSTAVEPFDLKTTVLPVGTSSIEASAGTGKTWTISHLVPRLLISGDLASLDQVVLVTFTEDAARELGERVRRELAALGELLALGKEKAPDDQPGWQALLDLIRAQGETEREATRARLADAAGDMDRLLAVTIHSFCRRVLADHSFLCGMPPGFDIETDDGPLKNEIAGDLWRGSVSSDPLLAALAAKDQWNPGQLIEAWKQSASFGDDALLPVPMGEAAARKALLAAWNEIRNDGKGIQKVLAALDSGAALLKKGFTDCASSLRETGRGGGGLPVSPDASSLDFVSWLAAIAAEGAFKSNSNEGKRLNAALAELSPIKAAAGFSHYTSQLHWAWLGAKLARARARYTRELSRRGLLSYDGLIERLHWALSDENPNGGALVTALRRRWKCALIDECQDTDGRQLDIFEKIFHAKQDGMRLVMIGDPKQSIYAFRGADLPAWLRSMKHVSKKTALGTTFRSADGLVKALHALWNRLEEPLGNDQLPVPPTKAHWGDEALALPDDDQGRLSAVVVTREAACTAAWSNKDERIRSAARLSAHAIRDLLGRRMSVKKGGPDTALLPGLCAVLTRTHREAMEVHEALRALQIPAVIRNSGDVMASELAGELQDLFAAILDPGNSGKRRLALSTELLGLCAPELRALDTDGALEARWKALFESWRQLWAEKRSGLTALLAAMERGQAEGPFTLGISARLALREDGERLLTDWRHLWELLSRKVAEDGLGPEALAHWFAQCRAEDDETPEERKRRLEEDGSAVSILTMHGAKGLEYDFVFCPFLYSMFGGKEEFPFIAGRVDGKRKLVNPSLLEDGKGDELRALADWENLEEGLRLAYVALTRAKRRAWFVCGYADYGGSAGHTPPPSPLDWLLRKKVDDETHAAWAARVHEAKRKRVEKGVVKDAWFCEHEDSLAELEAFCAAQKAPRLLTVEKNLKGLLAERKPWTPPGKGSALAPVCEAPASLTPWYLTSYSALVDETAAEKDRDDRPLAMPAKAGESAVVNPLMECFPSSKHTGNLFHDILERWDFSESAAALDAAIEHGVARHGHRLALKEGLDLEAQLKKVLPGFAQVGLPRLAGDATLGRAAAQASLSELPFMLPIGKEGLGGPMLRAVFEEHFTKDGREKDYARSLSNLSTGAIHGMLHGFIDRLAQVDGRWAVLDWKSNTMASREAYDEGSLWECAAESHYILQLHLYMVALRRYLAAFSGAELAGAGLCFLRGMHAGKSQGVLWFDARPDLLAGLDGLFAPAQAR